VLVFKPYGSEVATAAVKQLLTKTKGQVPNPAEVKKAAWKIKRVSDADKAGAAARMRQVGDNRQATDEDVKRITADWSDAELASKLESAKHRGDMFTAGRCEREIARRKNKNAVEKKPEVAVCM